MKKSLLFACVAGLVLSAGAQNRTTKNVVNIRNNRQILSADLPSNNVITLPAQRKTPLVITNAISDITLGWANNALGGYTRPARSICYADPNLNAVIVTHRSAPNCTPSDGTATSGSYMFDYSKNGGTSFNAAPSLGPVFDAGAELGRYPNGLIYNPAGNVTADNAYIAVYGPCTGPNMPGGSLWIANANGAAQLGNPSTTANQNTDWYDSTVNYTGIIPDCMVITQQGNTWVIDGDFDGTANYNYIDTLVVRKGTWNTTNHIFDYATTLIPFPVIAQSITGEAIAFAPDGKTGYIVVSGNNDLSVNTDTSNYLSVLKTTDGGATWSAPTKVFCSAPAAAALGGTGIFTTVWNPDASVDANGNLYINISIFPSMGGGSIDVTPGNWGQFAVYTTDGGATYKFHLLDTPSTYATGPTTGASPITEYTRGQIATNWACDKMVFIWFDTDTTVFTGTGNSNPNALGMFYDVTTQSWGPSSNLTANSPSDGSVTFGDVSYYLLPGTGSNWKIPMSYQVISANDESICAQWHYIDGAELGPVYTALSTSVTADGCPSNNSGSASISVTGGAAPLTYMWSPGGQTTASAAGIASGNYTVVVTDANGISATGFAFVPSTGITATITASTSVSCYGGSNATATASLNGTGPYTFAWSTSPAQVSATATGLAAGTYTVVGTTSNGCVGKTSVTITQPAQIAATATVTAATTCSGTDGSAVALATGGTSPYSYVWNSTPAQSTASATGLGGTYTLTVTDANSCSASQAITVTQPAMAITTTVTVPVSCFGTTDGSAMASVSTANGGTSPYTYVWNSTPAQSAATASGLGAGTYSVVVTSANGCTAVAAAAVTEPTALTVTVIANNGTCSTCGSATALPTGGTAPFSYSWNNGATTAVISGMTAGVYTVCVTDAHGCTKCASTTLKSAIYELDNSVFSISAAYPNPSTGVSTFEITMKRTDNISVEVSNMIGQVIYTSNATLSAGAHKVSIDASKWNSGIYFYTVKSTDFSTTGKLVRE